MALKKNYQMYSLDDVREINAALLIGMSLREVAQKRGVSVMQQNYSIMKAGFFPTSILVPASQPYTMQVLRTVIAAVFRAMQGGWVNEILDAVQGVLDTHREGHTQEQSEPNHFLSPAPLALSREC